MTESIQAALDSKAAGWGVMVSHWSGETEDNLIADLSVGLASGQIHFMCDLLLSEAFGLERDGLEATVLFGHC